MSIALRSGKGGGEGVGGHRAVIFRSIFGRILGGIDDFFTIALVATSDPITFGRADQLIDVQRDKIRLSAHCLLLLLLLLLLFLLLLHLLLFPLLFLLLLTRRKRTRVRPLSDTRHRELPPLRPQTTLFMFTRRKLFELFFFCFAPSPETHSVALVPLPLDPDCVPKAIGSGMRNLWRWCGFRRPSTLDEGVA